MTAGDLRRDHVSDPPAPGPPQVISDLRAKLSNASYPTNVLQNDDQGLLTRDGKSVILVPSNGYTFERTPTQVRYRAQGFAPNSYVMRHGRGTDDMLNKCLLCVKGCNPHAHARSGKLRNEAPVS